MSELQDSGVPEFNKIDLEELLKREEDEAFDRTTGGQENIGKAIAAFGTKNGGLLLVGQNDFKHGGEVVGIIEEEFQREFAGAIPNVKPTPLTQQKILEAKGKKLALIRVQDVGVLRPCSYKGIYYERKGESNHPLSPDEVRRYHLLYGSANPENMPTHARKNDIDEQELEAYVKLIGKSRDNLLQSIMSGKGFLTVRGVVVLSKKPDDFLEGAFVEIQRYDSVFGSPPVPVGPAVRISKPARQMIEEVTKTIEQNLPVSRTYEGARMVQAPAIPVSIIREAVTNSIAHRNYRSYEHVRVRIYADGFDISNPAAITERTWAEILAAQTTYHPNEGIYTFLNPAQLFEGRGEGIWKMREELERMGRAAPEFKVIGDTPSTFYARISLSPARARDVKRRMLDELIAKKREAAESKAMKMAPGAWREGLREREITTSEVMKRLKISRVTAINLLRELVAQGILEHTGSTKTSKYFVRQFNQKPAPTS